MDEGLADPTVGRIARVRISAALVFTVFLFNASIVAFLVAAVSDSTLVVFLTLAAIGGVVLVLAGLANTFFVGATGARALGPGEHPWLQPMVEDLAEAAGARVPEVLVAEQTHMNAYAVGSGEDAKIVFFNGLLQGLSREEVRAVASHELGHIINADTSLAVWTWAILRWVLLVKLAALAAAFMLFAFSREFFQAFNDMGIIGVVIGLTLGLMGILTAAALWLTAQGWALLASFIDLALCRQREFLADATGTAIDGRPDLLASALAKMSSGPPMATGAGTVGSLCIAPPAITTRWWEDFLSTHPSTERRIDELLKLPRGPQTRDLLDVGSSASLAVLFPIGSLVIIVLIALLIPQLV